MLSLEEREERRKQIGASEIHILLNFDTETAQDLFELKIGLQDYVELENDAVIAGNILEEQCLEFYAKSNNLEIVMNERIEHPRIKGLVASLDGRELKTSIPIENKVINEKKWASWIAKRVFNAKYGDIKLNIPKNYYCQTQTQMAVCNTEKAILNVNTLTDEEQIDPINVTITELHNKQIIIERDDDLISQLEKRAKYMLYCIKYKHRPSENDYLEKNLF